MNFSPDEIFAKQEIAAEEMAKAMAQSEYMENMRKVMFNKIRSDHAGENPSANIAKLDQLAYSDPKYQAHLQGQKSARYTALRTQARYRDLKDLGQYRQTQAVTERQMTN